MRMVKDSEKVPIDVNIEFEVTSDDALLGTINRVVRDKFRKILK